MRATLKKGFEMRVKKNIYNENTITNIDGFEIIDGHIKECAYQIDGNYGTTDKMLEKVRVEHPTFTSASTPTVSKVKKYVPSVVFNRIATADESIADDSNALAQYIVDSIVSLQIMLNDINTSEQQNDATD